VALRDEQVLQKENKAGAVQPFKYGASWCGISTGRVKIARPDPCSRDRRALVK
jgi:hypothetical protein